MKRLRPFASLGLFAFLALRAHGADQAAEPALQMSPFEVSANSVDFKNWIKIGSPHYVLYTDASDKKAAAALRELESMHLAMQGFFQRRAQNLPPVVLVLPTRHSDWRKIESKGSVQWTVAVSDPAEQIVNLVLVQYDWENEGLWIVRAAQSRAVLRALGLDGPFWFGRGISKFFETAEFSGDTVKLGQQNSRTLHLMQSGWMDWPKLFHITEDSPEFTRDDGTVDQIDGQCAAFAHFVLANPDPAWLPRYLDWAARLEAGREPTEAEFKSVFGQDWKKWQGTMSSYLNGGRFQLNAFRLPKTALEFATNKFALPVREMRELFVLAQILNQHVPASTQALDSVIAKGLKSDPLRELLVEACFARERPEIGRLQLEKLAAGHSPNPAVYSTLAMEIAINGAPQISVRKHLGVDEIHEIRQLRASIHTRFDADRAREIRSLCGQALALEPLFVPALDLLLWTEALGPDVGPENFAAIERHYHALTGYASTSDAVAAMGVAAWRAGDLAWARRIAQTLAESPYSDKDARRVSEELLKELGAAIPGPATVPGER